MAKSNYLEIFTREERFSRFDTRPYQGTACHYAVGIFLADGYQMTNTLCINEAFTEYMHTVNKRDPDTYEAIELVDLATNKVLRFIITEVMLYEHYLKIALENNLY